jgi:hypothetical protein
LTLGSKYSLNGIDSADQYVLDTCDGRWTVSFSERGSRREIAEFDCETDAALHLLNRVLVSKETEPPLSVFLLAAGFLIILRAPGVEVVPSMREVVFGLWFVALVPALGVVGTGYPILGLLVTIALLLSRRTAIKGVTKNAASNGTPVGE